jgi:prephenate dehydrogenase
MKEFVETTDTKNIAIIGLGLIGGSFAKALKQADKSIHIGAYDRTNIIQQALADGVIDTDISFIENALNYEIIMICLPIDESISIFDKLASQLKQGQIISDFCSVKKVFSELWNKNRKDGTYIGAHPMTGKEKGGYENSDPLLFENSVFIICDQDKSSNQKVLNTYIELVKLSGARITFLSPDIHDIITANVSHIPQLLSVLLVNQADKQRDDISFLDFAGGGFRDMTRIASSDFSVWKSILSNNSDEIINSLKEYSAKLNKLILLLEKNNTDAIKELFEKARTAREEIPFNNKGFLEPLFDITVFVKDEPGMISKISTVLFKENINIKDIELLKIREGKGGNFKFYFEDEPAAKRAKYLIEHEGFTTS